MLPVPTAMPSMARSIPHLELNTSDLLDKRPSHLGFAIGCDQGKVGPT
jgi:hypothetical protein